MMYPSPLVRGNKSKELPKIMTLSITTNNAENSKLSKICCFFFKNIVLEFSPQKCRKLFLSKIEVLTPWFSEIAKMVITEFVFKAFL